MSDTSSSALIKAISALRNAKPIIFPTETFYAIGCDALCEEAVKRVFTLKKRNFALPLPVVIGNHEMIGALTDLVTPTAKRLMEQFWPGPLSILFPARQDLPDMLTGGTGRVAVRFSPHVAVQELCMGFNGPLVASSANISGRPAVASLADLDPDLRNCVRNIYTSGLEPNGGQPSTIVSVLEDDKKIIQVHRQGAVPISLLRRKGFIVSEA